MKRVFFLSLAITLSQSLVSQDYQCILSSGEHMFTNGDYYRAIKIDSVVEFNDHNVLYNYFVIGTTDTYSECYTNTHPSWIGYRMDAYENGHNYFFNLEGDSILIKTHAQENEEWVCYAFDNGDYVRGKVMGITETDFLELTDSVKTIQFNAFDNAGNPLSHSINGKKIKVSKSWGIIQALNFKIFPDLDDYPYYEEIQEYQIVGMLEPETGIQNLQIKDIYDFELGDEFHVYEFSNSWLQDNFHYYEIHRVLSKQWISDTVVAYDMEQCNRRYYVYSDTLIMNHDTTWVEVNINTHEDAGINEVPDKYLLGELLGWGEEEYYWYLQEPNEEFPVMRKTFFGGYFYDVGMDCILPMIDYDYSCYYLKGLGGPYWHYGTFGSENYRGLVYYKKGNEEWGEPYDCDSLLLDVPQASFTSPKVHVSPNPVNLQTQIFIENWQGAEFNYRIYNATGSKVKSGIIYAQQTPLECKNLHSGIYFFVLMKGSDVLKTEKLIIR